MNSQYSSQHTVTDHEQYTGQSVPEIITYEKDDSSLQLIIKVTFHLMDKKVNSKAKALDGLFFAINGNDIVDRLFHVGDCFISKCLLQKNNTFLQNVFNSWLELMKG